MKKIFFILVILAFLTSYFLKNFQMLLLSLSLLTLLGLFFKKINKNFIISIFSILITLTIIEISLKYKSGKKLFKLSNSKNLNKNIRYQKSFLGYNPLPGVQNHLRISNGKKLIDSNYTIKKDGFRKTPLIKDNSKDLKVNFFGGSFVFGWGLNDNETLPYLIQDNFDKWKVRNYGINGYGVHQMLTQIINDKQSIGDINFLITQNSHIPRSACKRDYSFGTPKYILNSKSQIIRSGYCNNLFIKNLQIPKILGSIINRSEIKKIVDIYFFKKYQFTQNDINLYTGIIKKINDLVLKENKYFFVGYIRTNFTDIDTKVLNYFKDNQINLIDLTLENNENYELYDGHPSKEANLQRSKIIFTFLKDLNF